MRLDDSPAWKALTARLEGQAIPWRDIPQDFLVEVLATYGVAPAEGKALDPVEVLISLHAARVCKLDPNEVAKLVEGEVQVEILYVPRRSVMRDGYASLRKMTLWAAGKSQVAVPPNVQVVLRWLRDHFGPKEVVEDAKKQFNKGLFDKPLEGVPRDES